MLVIDAHQHLWDTGGGPDTDWLTWVTGLLRDAIELFGPDRLTFASDWPVSTGRGSDRLARWIVAAAVTGLSAADQDRVFRGTACAVYGLSDQGGA
jgi:L-fuconolactonase